MRILRRLSTAFAVSVCACRSASTQSPPATAISPATGSGIAAKTAGMERRDGFIPLYVDAKQGKLLLEIPRDSMRALMFVTLATGLGWAAGRPNGRF